MISFTEDEQDYSTIRGNEGSPDNQASFTVRPESSPLDSMTVQTYSPFLDRSGAPAPECHVQAPAGHEMTYTNQHFKDSLNSILYGSSLASWYRGQGLVPPHTENSQGWSTWDGGGPTDISTDDETRQAALLLQTLGDAHERT
ncbi:hypothetical protein BDP55DRAFT_629752 [Colletotrichum godetiae]|uniref:Uncharacterized protein n=1 Tax=Colletotrichum godetiae TaxID=1209918 RepID=A0AAJ0AQT8_9PEZI|nr:uncharacterized protein BDP55DRAFT_629752 [Colletotrichum godetiae]KAK1688672.1 hypothetical protein BDP55DRAFT_629752 [Colletotrichum godetiae]